MAADLPLPNAPDPGDLDRAVRELQHDVTELQAEIRMLKGQLLSVTGKARDVAGARPMATRTELDIETTAGMVLPKAARTDDTERRAANDRRSGRGRRDMEALVGRYATIALGALLLVMGAGVLLSWAVQRIQFGPAARVSLGALGAAIVAGVGVWLRARGSRPFGSTLLGIALALVHVDAWGAGPSLQVIPNAAALAIAALASAALAALAWITGEEALFVVGVGGAFTAPFVTAGKHSDVLMLMLYGWVVLAAGMLALRGRSWKYATRLLALAVAAYAVAAMSSDWSGASRMVRDAPSTFALACAATALAASARSGSRTLVRTLVRTFVWIAALALMGRAFRPEHPNDVALLAGLGTAIAYVAAHGDRGRDRAGRRAAWLVTTIAAPLVFLALAAVLPTWSFTGRGTSLAAAWGASALLAAWDSEELRDGHLLVAGLACSYAAVGLVRWLPLAPATVGLLEATALALVAALFGVFARRTHEPLRLVAPALSLCAASLWAYHLLTLRPAFAYAPFLTTASAAALAAVGGWLTLTLCARAMPALNGAGRLQPCATLAAVTAFAAFLWGHEELARAGSIEVSIFLVILYLAGSGVLSIFAGRRWGSAAARRSGLAVAVYAALKAMYQVSDFDSVALRIGAYVLVGSFLLAVAFWYRTAGDQCEAGSTTKEAGLVVSVAKNPRTS